MLLRCAAGRVRYCLPFLLLDWACAERYSNGLATFFEDNTATSASALQRQLQEVRLIRHSADAQAEAAAQDSQEAETRRSTLVAQRYQLVEQLSSEAKPRQHMDLPPSVSEEFPEATFLGSGSFGEVWKAEDTHDKGRPVAIKLFFLKPEGGSNEKHIPLTRRLAAERHMQRRLEFAQQECDIAKSLQQFSHKDPLAASLLMQCLADHTGSEADGEQLQSDDDPLYQVFEYCGSTDLSKWTRNSRRLLKDDPEEYINRALDIFLQLLYVLRYLTSHDTRWVHHDLKPENIMILEAEDGSPKIKVIDLGSMTEASAENARKRSVSSVAYAEPDFFLELGDYLLGGKKWLRGYNQDKPESYDIYAAGSILDEITTGKLTFDKFKTLAAVDQTPPYYFEMCKRGRVMSRLQEEHAEDSGSGDALGASLKEAKKHEDQDQQLCDRFIKVLLVKGSNGAEPRVTARWGAGANQTTDDADEEQRIDRALFGASGVEPAFADAASAYLSKAKKFDWLPAWKSMLALDPRKRPRAAELLETEFWQHVEGRRKSSGSGRRPVAGDSEDDP
eukprot:TRINITY_DN25659_c0_g1_i3.p1 TRINITY_DN25659_c0_g1~~TRINITY_DN25659_c0_g1_i3.p1  ORF type:complete len:561 (-),score=142.09 TRINITY_DN25659_c0_g1_i3:267-1949(-)